MKVPRRLGLLCALALTGCVSTNDEPFPLDDGDAVSPAVGGYVCVSYDSQGKRTPGAQQGRVIALRRNNRTQYVFVDDKTSSASPFTLHRAGGNLTIVSVAHSDAPGEDFYVTEFRDGDKHFKVYAEGEDFEARAQALARQHGVTFMYNPFSSALSGPVDGQKAFMIDLASDLKGWRLSADCRARP